MPEKDVDFLATARKRFAAAAEDEKQLREKFIDDLRFASPDGDEQWDAKIAMDRKAAGRPTLAFPRCHTFVQQVSNEARQNKPQIKFSPRLDADKDTADVYEGLARYIQYASDAQIAYETAIEYSAGGSFGYYRFLTDYCDDESDDLDLKVVPVLDPLAIYGVLVPACFNRKPMFAFVVEDIPKEEFKQQYPDSEISGLSWAEAERDGEGWVGSETVRVAEYWYTEQGKGKRPKTKVKFCKTNGLEVLKDSETDWPGSTIPIIPVLGKQMIMEGKPRLFSVVRPQKSAQQLINYSKSRIAETLSTSPISPFMAVEGQIEGYEEQWKTLNTVPRAVLTYKAVDVAGRPAERPTRDTFEPPIQALSSFVAQEVDDMKATSGIFDASLGNKGNETSGQAIARRQQQSDLTTMHFMDNLTRAHKKGGLVIAEMIPLIYDGEREVEILGEDEATKVVQINKEHQNEKTGKMQHFDMTKGKYVPIVTVGKAFDSKRMESFDTMQQVLQTTPDLIHMIGDIFFKNSDMAGADQLAERFKKALPPNLQDNEGEEQVPPQAQAQIQQLSQHLQAINAAAKQYEQQIQALEFEKKAGIVKSQSDWAIAKLRAETALAEAEVNTKAQNVNERLTFVEDMVKQFHAQAHEQAMQAAGAQQQQQAQAQQAGHQQDLQAQSADAQSQQSAQDAQQQQQAQQNQPQE